MIKSRQEVEAFIGQFLPKFSVFGIFFLDREKNKKALLQLNMSPREREDVIKNISADDYVETLTDLTSWGEMWVFGKDVNSKELYIKIAMGKDRTICISFHLAEHPLNYAFK